MKKIIKLTESDLHKVIKKVISEQPVSDPAQYSQQLRANANKGQAATGFPDPNILKTDLKLGDGGYKVSQLQQQLVTLGFPKPDGKYGPVTQKSVRDFQTAAKLPITGIADAATLKAIADQSRGRGLKSVIPQVKSTTPNPVTTTPNPVTTAQPTAQPKNSIYNMK
jgi:peptidoglycan hydrolase-like protein with peptidoglycan-binding domain